MPDHRPAQFDHKLENASLELLDPSTAQFVKWLSHQCYANPSDIPLFLPQSAFSYRYGPHFWTVVCVGYEIVYDESTQPDSPSSSHSTSNSSTISDATETSLCAQTPNHAVYLFEVTRGAERRIVRYRFSQILRFISALYRVPKLGGFIGDIAPPSRQPWRLWGRFEKSFLDSRVDELNVFFEKMLRLHIGISSLYIVRWFFDLDSFDKRLWFYSFAKGGHPKQNTKHIGARLVDIDQYLTRCRR